VAKQLYEQFLERPSLSKPQSLKSKRVESPQGRVGALVVRRTAQLSQVVRLNLSVKVIRLRRVAANCLSDQSSLRREGGDSQIFLREILPETRITRM
jgi:hypothetical protein